MSTGTTKRKAAASTTSAAKKARLAQTAAMEFDIRKSLLELALYARRLEDKIHALEPQKKSPKELQAAAEKIRVAARSGIRKQMTWKPSCKTSSARFVYDGVCADPAIFGAFLGLDGPPSWKTKKFPKDVFQDLVGNLDVPIRYDTLRVSSDINISWKATEGTLKCTGSYGK